MTLTRFILNLIKKTVLKFINKISIAIATIPITRKHCCICGKDFLFFIPHVRWYFPKKLIANKLDIIGSDMKHFHCPKCFCNDRERHLYLYMLHYGIFKELSKYKVLHFAPEKMLQLKIVQQKPKMYLTCDLYPSSKEIYKIDMLAIPFKNDTLDLIIANHVLEHVYDDSKAVAELYRVLKPEGLLVLQIPFSKKLENSLIIYGKNNDYLRYHICGQIDHLRVFGQNCIEEIKKHGFLSLVTFHESLLLEIDPIKFGLNKHEPFFLFKKQSDRSIN